MKQNYFFNCLLLISGVVFAQEVTTLAGSGTFGDLDGYGVAATFYYPFGLTVSNMGDVYVADTYNHKIRKISATGLVTTIAGSGTRGNEDGVALMANFDSPTDVVIDKFGNIYVADWYSHKIRKITSEGQVITFAGSGVAGSDDGIGVNAKFYNPYGLAIDGFDNIYVADYGSHKIRKITPQGIVSTIAGSGEMGSNDGLTSEASFNYPIGVAIDSHGYIYVADTSNHKIRKISPLGLVTTLAGSGIAGSNDDIGINATFKTPSKVEIDAFGNVYVADTNNNKIRKISQDGVVTTYVGSGVSGSNDGSGTDAKFNNPVDVAVDKSGNLYVADLYNHKIRKIVFSLNDNDFVSLKDDFVIYPNPVQSILNFNVKREVNIEIYDLVGKKVMTKKTLVGINTFDMSGLNSGVYFLKVLDDKGISETIKFLKQ